VTDETSGSGAQAVPETASTTAATDAGAAESAEPVDAPPQSEPQSEPQPQRRLPLLLSVAAVVLALDVVTKVLAVRWLTPGQPVSIVGDTVTWTLVRNSGAAFSMATGYTWALTLVATGVVIGIVWMGRRLVSPWWALGLGMISKYTIVFFGVSMTIYLLTSKRDRRWLATPWPYLAAVLALVLFSPVTWWNAQHDWASIRFQGKERFGSANEFRLVAFAKFLGQQWGAVVPFTLPLAAAAVWRAARSSRPDERYLFWCFVPMMGFFAALSWRMPTHTLWPLPAWLGITVVMAGMSSCLASAIGNQTSSTSSASGCTTLSILCAIDEASTEKKRASKRRGRPGGVMARATKCRTDRSG